jgi:hypothetical protein
MGRTKTIGLAALAAMTLMAFIGASSASATTMKVTTATQNSSVTITATLQSGASVTVKNTPGTPQNTCTTSDTHNSTEPPYTASRVKVSGGLSLSNCTRNVTVHSAGSLYFEHIEGTENATVYSEEMEVTVGAPLVGYLTLKTSESTQVGTLTGVGHGQATLHLNAVVDCGISCVVEGPYVITSPDGFSSSP